MEYQTKTIHCNLPVAISNEALEKLASAIAHKQAMVEEKVILLFDKAKRLAIAVAPHDELIVSEDFGMVMTRVVVPLLTAQGTCANYSATVFAVGF